MSKKPTLTQQIDAFLAEHGMSPVTFGRKAMKDPHFVRDIKADPPRRVWPETEDRVRAFMDAYPSEGEVRVGGQRSEAA